PENTSFQESYLTHQMPTASGSQRGQAVCGGVDAVRPRGPRSRPGAEERPDAGSEPHGQRPPEGDAQGTHRHPGPAHTRRDPAQEREAYQGRARDDGYQTRLRGEGGDQERQGGAPRDAAGRCHRRLEPTRTERLGYADFAADMRASPAIGHEQTGPP